MANDGPRAAPLDAVMGEFKLGRVERSIMQTLGGAGGLTEREAVVDAAFPEVVADGPGGGRGTRRARAEAATSRAILSLERKGLVQRQRNARTGRTLLSLPGLTDMPDWEQIARAEEDLAAHCRKAARAWDQLAARARGRAQLIRRARSVEATEVERSTDLHMVADLEGSTD